MKKLYAIVFLVLSSLTPLLSQWNVLPTGTTQPLYSVDYYSSSEIWAGSFNQFLKSTNAGANWTIYNPIKDGANANIMPVNVTSIKVTGVNTAIQTGLYYIGNSECIYQTSNGGSNWNVVSLNNSVPLLRYLEAIDLSPTTAVVVGNNGRIGRSTNQGSTWNFVTSGTTNLIRDVKFAAGDTVYACGDNVILKSVDAGLTWSLITSFTGEFNSVSCKQNVVYVADRMTSQLLKSVNSGASYTVLTLPFSSEGVIHAINKDTLLASGQDGMYISKSGGQYWEKFILPSYQVINEFDFLSSSQGIAVGDSGYVVQTNNLWSAPSIPISSFSIQGGAGNFCIGDSITLLNSTAPISGYTYDWKYNGVSFSTQYNTGINLNTEGTHTITLAVSNANGTDTAAIQINVWGHSMNPIVINASADSVCSGTYVEFTVPNSDIGYQYRLRTGYSQIGSTQNGTGGILTFSVPSAITSTTTFNIKSSRTNFCFTDSIVQYKTISLVSAPSPTTSCIPPVSVCSASGILNVTFGTFNNSTNTLVNNYFDYSCCYHSNVTMGSTYPISVTVNNPAGENVKGWIDYNANGIFDNPSEVAFVGFANPTYTANIVIDTTTFFNQKIRMRVISDQWGSGNNLPCNSTSCGQTEDYALTILPAAVPPVAGFTKTQIVKCTTSVSCTNTSWNATSYSWDFGDGSPAVNTPNASHVYTTSGTYTITLTAQNPTGSHVSTQTISVVIPQVPIAAACTPLIGAQSFSYVGLMSHLDLDGSPIYNPISWSSSYKDSTCTPQLHLAEGTTHTLSFYMTNWSNSAKVGVWIDYNNDGAFTAAENLFGGVALTIPSTTWGMNQSFLVGAGVSNTPLRMRVLLYDPQLFIMNGCGFSGTLSGGEMLDYSVYIDPPGPAAANFTANPVTACTNQLVTFTNTSANASSAYWEFGDGTTSTQISPSHAYTTAGVYSVKLIAINSQDSDTLIKTSYITINQAPVSPTVTVNGNVLSCSTTGTAYQWYMNSAPISGATSQTYTATQDGNYYVIVYNGSCYAYSNTLAYFPPHANFTASPLNACPATNINFQNLGSNGTSYTWHFGDGTTLTTPNVTYPFHSYAAGGLYTVKLVVCNTMGCDSMEKPNYINIYAAPPVPVVLQNGTQLYTNAVSPTYQWYKNGVIIPGATSSTYNPSQYDYYSVRVSNANGCYSYSANYPYFAVLAGFSADTTAYCGVTSASVDFTDTSINATSWTWDFGDGNTSNLMNPTHVYNSAGTYTVNLIVCNGPDCDTAVSPNYITIDPNPFSITLSPAVTTNICSGDSVLLTVSGAGAISYAWYLNGSQIAAAVNSTFYALLDGTYNALAYNGSGCVAASDTATLIVDYACVWPGDADNDYWVSNYDLLPVGLFYGSTGTARSVVSNAWQANPVTDWGVIYQSWGSDIKHADCNGDGVIDDNDTLAISLNYSAIHNLAPADPPTMESRVVDPPAYFTSSSVIYYAGDTIEIEIHAGDSAMPVNNFYGWAFDVNYTTAYSEPGTMTVQYPASWLGTPGTDMIKIAFIDEPAGVISGAVSRTDQTNRDGFGVVAKLRFKASTAISSPVTMNFSIPSTWSIDSSETAVPLSPVAYSIDIYPLATAAEEHSDNDLLNIYPNPFRDKIFVNYHLQNKTDVKLELFDAAGRLIKSVSKPSQTPGQYHCAFELNAGEMSKGIYFVKYTANDQVYFRKVVKME